MEELDTTARGFAYPQFSGLRLYDRQMRPFSRRLWINRDLPAWEKNGGDDGTRTRGLCRDSLGIYVLSATYILAGAAKSLKGTVGTVRCG